MVYQLPLAQIIALQVKPISKGELNGMTIYITHVFETNTIAATASHSIRLVIKNILSSNQKPLNIFDIFVRYLNEIVTFSKTRQQRQIKVSTLFEEILISHGILQLAYIFIPYNLQ